MENNIVGLLLFLIPYILIICLVILHKSLTMIKPINISRRTNFIIFIIIVVMFIGYMVVYLGFIGAGAIVLKDVLAGAIIKGGWK